MILQPLVLFCERAGPGLFAEPLNLAASTGFVVSAVLIWHMAGASSVLRWLAATTFLLFPGTVFLHMLPSPLAVGVLIATILPFVGVFFFAISRDMLGLSSGTAIACTLLVLPLTAASLPLLALFPGAAGSMSFLPLAILLLGYAAVLRAEHPIAAQGLLTNALILGVSLGARAADLAVCSYLPRGTVFIWISGAALLSWHMAWVYRAHMLAGGGGGR